MAPPRGPRSTAAQPARETRSSSLGARPSARGGIQKRRGGRPTQTDRDGDLDMDAAAANAARRANNKPTTAEPSGGRAPRPTRGTAPLTRPGGRVQQAIARHLDRGGATTRKPQNGSGGGLVWLTVRGLKDSKAANNEGGGLRDLLSFLERKATSLSANGRPVVIKKSSIRGDAVTVAANKEDAEEILKLNSFMFAGTKLDITDPSGSLAQAAVASTAALETKQQLTTILSQRYITEAKLLKLDALNQDVGLVQMGMLESKERAEKMFRATMKICDDLFKTRQEKADAIQSVSLANNGLDSINQVEVMAETFPDLKNLDLSGNQISSITSGLSRWKGKLGKLETIYLAGNPVLMGESSYKSELLNLFPKLQNINGEQLTPQQIADLQAANRPQPIPQNGPDFRDANGIGEAFLLEFFTAYDTDRVALLSKYYDEASQFSLAVDTVSIRDLNSAPPLSWSAYIKQSRNLTKITHTASRAQRLSTGREGIYKLWNDLPATKHPDVKSEIGKYIMDCHLLQGLADPTGQAPTGVDGMIISMHGQFEEFDKNTSKTGLRSFSRTFVLGPGIPGNNPIRVISDMLSLRAFNGLPNLFAEAAPVAQDEGQQRQAMIAELSKQTRMTPTYSEMCLSDVAWDFTRALAVFNEKKTQLPAEAFVSM